MKNELITTGELGEYFSEENFVDLTREQILKDLFGLLADELQFEINFEEKVYPQFVSFLTKVLDELSSSGTLPQFIYKVDLNENEFHKMVYSNDIEGLVDLIIRREAKKVFLRRTII